jgi:hypothetical protein
MIGGQSQGVPPSPGARSNVGGSHPVQPGSAPGRTPGVNLTRGVGIANTGHVQRNAPTPPPRLEPQPNQGQPHFNAFLADVTASTDKFTRSRSSLSSLLDFLERNVKTPVRFVGDSDDARVVEAMRKCANPRDPRLTKYKAAIKSLVNVWGTNATYQPAAKPAAVAPATTNTSGRWSKSDVLKWVNAVADELNEFCSYACADAFSYTNRDPRTGQRDYSSGFAACINPKKRIEVEKRHDALRGTQGAATPGDANIPGAAWKPENYANVYKHVKKNKAAICTQFAKAAAHVLTHDRPHGPRVEIVAFKNHVYVLVGRQGAVATSAGKWTLPASWKDDPAVVIVDPWAGSLGWKVIYETYSDYDLQAMSNPIELIGMRAAS